MRWSSIWTRRVRGSVGEAAVRSVSILGVRVDAVSRAQALTVLAESIRSGRPRQVVTVNPEFLVQARSDPHFAACLRGAALALADGVGLLLAARFLGRPLPGRVTGVDLTEDLAALCARHGYRMYLLGAGAGVAEAAARVLTERYPGLVIAGCFAGSPSPEHDADLVARVCGARPDVLLVAYGAPAQDLWIARNLAAIGAPIAVGVGGTFDYLSGRVPRAPAAVRAVGLEWLYRLIRQPWRWRRQLRLPVFLALVVRQRLTERA
jgi:N-acetylglucosaminyldiphosphoundecaprenol N-acetyl-beta-D-mannosaminyltransferase